MESGVSSTAIPNVVVTEIDAPVDALVSPSTPGSVHSESGDASPHGELPHDRGSPESHWTPANVADRLNAAQLRIRLLPRLQVTAIETQVRIHSFAHVLLYQRLTAKRAPGRTK